MLYCCYCNAQPSSQLYAYSRCSSRSFMQMCYHENVAAPIIQARLLHFIGIKCTDPYVYKLETGARLKPSTRGLPGASVLHRYLFFYLFRLLQCRVVNLIQPGQPACLCKDVDQLGGILMAYYDHGHVHPSSKREQCHETRQVSENTKTKKLGIAST